MEEKIKKIRRFPIRFTKSEYEKLKIMHQEEILKTGSKKSLSGYCKNKILNVIKNKMPQSIIPENDSLYTDFHSIGLRINETAKSFNSGIRTGLTASYKTDLTEIKKILERILNEGNF